MSGPRKSPALRWAGRVSVYVLGLFFIAVGIGISVQSGLGVSPVGSPANVLYRIGLDRGWPAGLFSLGSCTIMVYCVYILEQLVLLRRRFRPVQLLQLVVSVLFGYLVDLARAALFWLPEPTAYWQRLLCLLASIPFVALGVLLYLKADLIPTPGEGTALAIADTFRTRVPTGKTVFDCHAVLAAAVLSLAYFRGFVGVREGTVISALLTGPCMHLMQKLFPGLRTK